MAVVFTSTSQEMTNLVEIPGVALCAICTSLASHHNYSKEGPLFVRKEPTQRIAWLQPWGGGVMGIATRPPNNFMKPHPPSLV